MIIFISLQAQCLMTFIILLKVKHQTIRINSNMHTSLSQH